MRRKTPEEIELAHVVQLVQEFTGQAAQKFDVNIVDLLCELMDSYQDALDQLHEEWVNNWRDSE